MMMGRSVLKVLLTVQEENLKSICLTGNVEANLWCLEEDRFFPYI